MSKKQYTDKDLLAILTEVEVEFKKHLNPESEGEKIAKSEENISASQENDTAKAESLDYDEEDVAEMEKMYKSMSKSEAEVHFKAIRKAIGEESAEMNKSEDKVVVKEDAKVVEENKLLKSENETIKSENEELKKSLEKFTQILSKVFGKGNSAPKQKAVTEMEVIKKSEEDTKKSEDKDLSKLSQSEINSKLTAKIKSGEIKKSDKEAIYKYFDNKSIELVKHLL